jgi:endoglucanase
MEFTTRKLTLAFLIVLLMGAHVNVYSSSADSTDYILLNQIGYAPQASKIALIRANVAEFKVMDANTGKVIFKEKTGKPAYWQYSGDTVRTADFTSVSASGNYKVSIGKQYPESPVFSIGSGLYTNVSKAAVRALYMNRCSFEIEEKYAGKFKRPAGHPDTVVFIHESAATDKRPVGTIISSPGGWYDAGDYNKYIVNSGITTYTMLLFYQMFPAYCKKLNLNIPESGNTIPDPLDETLYNLKWMLTMQDTDDGGVYHKLTNKSFDPFVMPDKATEPRYVVQKSTSAALDFTAVMAIAYRLFATSDIPELNKLASTCLSAAKKAYQWAKENPRQFYRQPKDILTGGYGDGDFSDEFFWAAVELALATNDTSLIAVKDIQAVKLVTPSWAKVDALGILSLALTNNAEFKAQKDAALARLEEYNETLIQKYNNSAYKISLDYFNWGSNSDVANQALLKVVAYKITGRKAYLPLIQSDADYILGRNATGYCFVTGFGSKTLMNIHHRPSVADGVVEPVPGFLSGGPNTATFSDCDDKVTRSKFPAKSFSDKSCSYSTNEIAINWNAPLFFLMGALDSID